MCFNQTAVPSGFNKLAFVGYIVLVFLFINLCTGLLSNHCGGVFLREHPFNLKRGGGGYGFFQSQFFFRFAAEQKICRDIIFFQ